MALHRLTTLTMAVPDVAASTAFLGDFGLEDAGGGAFKTRDGGEQLRLVEAPRRQLLRLGVGAEDADDLGRVAQRCSSQGFGKLIQSSDESVLLSEPVTGLEVEITVAEPVEAGACPAPSVNRPGEYGRLNATAQSVLASESVRPSNLTHVAYTTPDLETTVRFFLEVVGFDLSDRVPILAFTRCGEVHHNLALQHAPLAFPHHIAFEVDDVDDVVRGGAAMVDGDPNRHVWGVGRHAIGSNWFWYLREPSGTFFEYAADVDRISDQDLYQPKGWEGRENIYSYGPPIPKEFVLPSDIEELLQASA